MESPATIHFTGTCPFLLCLDTGPHDHPVCPKCQTVNYANMDCLICQIKRPEYEAQLRRIWEIEKAVMQACQMGDAARMELEGKKQRGGL